MYREYRPSPLLSAYVDSFWTAEGYIENEFCQTILPDGCVDLLFSFGDFLPRNETHSDRPYLIGTMIKPLEVFYKGKMEMLGVRFKPAGITAFVKTPLDSLTNRRVDLSLADTVVDPYLHEILSGLGGQIARIKYLDAYLLQGLAYPVNRRIIRAVNLIDQVNGNLNMAGLAKEVCLSQRHFERQFKAAVGISPKLYSQVKKFNYACRLLRNKDSRSIEVLAEDCGYYDLSHLTKDIKRFSGTTPAGL